MYIGYAQVHRRVRRRMDKRALKWFFTVFMAVDMAVSAGAVYRQYERVDGVPATNSVQEFFDRTFPDEVLKVIYPHMQYVGKPELPEKLRENQAIPEPAQ